jgi:hypothetical protein
MPHNFEENKLPSVTQILREMMPEPQGLKYWKNKNPEWERMLKERGNIGTLVHYHILNKLSPLELEPPDIDLKEYPDDIYYLLENAVEMWEHLYLNIEPLEVEQFHKNDKYCGTLDLLGILDDEVVLFDLKTSKAIYDNHLLQLGGYAGLLEDFPDKAMIISIHPFIETNPNLEVKTKVIDCNKLYNLTKEFNTLVDKWWDIKQYKKDIGGY